MFRASSHMHFLHMVGGNFEYIQRASGSHAGVGRNGNGESTAKHIITALRRFLPVLWDHHHLNCSVCSLVCLSREIKEELARSLVWRPLLFWVSRSGAVALAIIGKRAGGRKSCIDIVLPEHGIIMSAWAEDMAPKGRERRVMPRCV